jgi:hypothetical protein
MGAPCSEGGKHEVDSLVDFDFDGISGLRSGRAYHT